MLPVRLKRFINHKILGYPSSIILQTVSGCNLRCRHCFLNQFGTDIPDGPRGTIDFEEFARRAERIRPFIERAEYFFFSGFEALLHKDIFRMVEHVLAINPSVRFPVYTNGNSFAGDTLAMLSKFPVPEVVVSLDGVNKETVEAFKTGSSFERTVQTIRDLLGGLPRSAIKTVFVAHRDNLGEFPQYVDFVNSLGVKTVFVTNLLCFSRDLQQLALYREEGNPGAEAVFRDAIARARRNGQTLHLPRMRPERLGCRQCLELFIDIRGNICPCDYLSVTTSFFLFDKQRRGEPVVFGNILKDDARKIWFGRDYSSFRAMHKAAKVPDTCSCCTDAYGMLCSNRTVYR
ncbi:MAG TPA: radical SAM protein [Chitinivibrionales bacterium]|jgi:MoaA/NifB/PqqE/SkfB family radical SAM enzyme|nr:radical SAM protein [Chitinivibrionales bacterium]